MPQSYVGVRQMQRRHRRTTSRPSSRSNAIVVLSSALGRSSAAIAVLLLASRAEATPTSPCSSPPFWPKQRRHHLAPPRPLGKAAPSSPCSSPLLGPKQRRHSRAPSRPSGRSNAAITVLILAPRAEAAPPSSPCSPRPSGLPSTPWMWCRVAGNIHQGRGSSRAKLAPLPRSHAAMCSQAVEGAMSRPGGYCGAGERVGAVQPEGGRKGLK